MRSSVWSVDLCSSDSLTPCPLGRLLVAATLRGVCFVALGTRDGELIAQLHREYPAAAEITRDDELLGQSVANRKSVVEGESVSVRGGSGGRRTSEKINEQ